MHSLREDFCPDCRRCGRGSNCDRFASCAKWRGWFGERWRGTRALFGIVEDSGAGLRVSAADCVGDSFAERLRSLKEAAGVSWQQLAVLCGTSKKTLLRYARGDHSPSADTLSSIADAFGVSMDLLLGR